MSNESVGGKIAGAATFIMLFSFCVLFAPLLFMIAASAGVHGLDYFEELDQVGMGYRWWTLWAGGCIVSFEISVGVCALFNPEHQRDFAVLMMINFCLLFLTPIVNWATPIGFLIYYLLPIPALVIWLIMGLFYLTSGINAGALCAFTNYFSFAFIVWLFSKVVVIPVE